MNAAASVVARRMFRSLGNRNYRLYFIAQVISQIGTWMQTIAQSWLVLELTGSGAALGTTTMLQFLPIMLLGGMGGVIVDRFDRRRLLAITQSVAGAQASLLGILTLTGAVQLWMVYVAAPILGLVAAIDNPTRHSLTAELVSPDDLQSAVSLNSVVFNLARVLGPASAGLLISFVGVGECFVLNGLSFVAMLLVLTWIRGAELNRDPPQPRARGQLRDGLRYVNATPSIRGILVMMALIGAFAWEFEVTLPLLAKVTFSAGANAYGVLNSAMGVGAVLGGLLAASRPAPSRPAIVGFAAVYALGLAAVAASPWLLLAVACMVLVGIGSVGLLVTANSRVQLSCEPSMRGRVMALWTTSVLGSRPIGAPIVGRVSEGLGPRYGVMLGALSIVVLAVPAWLLLARIGGLPRPRELDPPSPSVAGRAFRC